MLKNYQDIDKYFGNPLDSVPKPKVPFKLKPWHVITVAVFLGFAGYGAKKFFEGNVKPLFTDKDKKKK